MTVKVLLIRLELLNIFLFTGVHVCEAVKFLF